MTQEQVGYHLIEIASNTVIQSWGGQWGQCPGVPNPIILPNGNHIHGASPMQEIEGYKIVAWMMDEPPPPFPETISKRQFYQQLAIMGVITKAEALGVLNGVLPAALNTYVSNLDANNQFTAEMLLIGAAEFQRHHPLTITIGTVMNWSDEDIDAFWVAASQI